ncbi:hypothetical protein CHS0354_039897 [Potamilus streckersoni]|uniref:Uncharacterized protein n=1 Tax=Potamilus streckersoni TaxID=2493646 RepID=A0AAE0TGS5_9BIVA|nr:hypothetical protein CHS0354_039897 [Potamilus streckersoni]
MHLGGERFSQAGGIRYTGLGAKAVFEDKKVDVSSRSRKRPTGSNSRNLALPTTVTSSLSTTPEISLVIDRVAVAKRHIDKKGMLV